MSEPLTILGAIADGTVSVAPAPPMSAAIRVSIPHPGRTSLVGTIRARLEDAILLLLAVVLLPVGILLVGMPIVLCARLVLEIVRRL